MTFTVNGLNNIVLIDSIFNKQIHPVIQAGVVLACLTAINLLLKLLSLVNIYTTSDITYWIVGASFILFFGMFNSLFSLSSKNQAEYWSRSIFAFAGLAISVALICYAFSGLSIYEASSMKWIFTVLTLVYIIFLTIVRLMRKIVDIAIKQDKKLRGEE